MWKPKNEVIRSENKKIQNYENIHHGDIRHYNHRHQNDYSYPKSEVTAPIDNASLLGTMKNRKVIDMLLRIMDVISDIVLQNNL
jgi:hypothetical protein